jgi:hypothetical protein
MLGLDRYHDVHGGLREARNARADDAQVQGRGRTVKAE